MPLWTRGKAVSWLGETLETQGRDAPWSDIRRKEFASVSRATFYRWLRQAKATYPDAGVRRPKEKATAQELAEAKKTVKEDRKRYKANLPDIPEPGYIASMSAPDIGAKLASCMSHAELLLAAMTKTDEDGTVEIVDPNIYLRASDHLRKSVETMAKISEIIWDVRRTEAFHRKIFEVMRRHDPTLVHKITVELEQLNRDQGLF